jgi:hypothetical protein
VDGGGSVVGRINKVRLSYELCIDEDTHKEVVVSSVEGPMIPTIRKIQHITREDLTLIESPLLLHLSREGGVDGLIPLSLGHIGMKIQSRMIPLTTWVDSVLGEMCVERRIEEEEFASMDHLNEARAMIMEGHTTVSTTNTDRHCTSLSRGWVWRMMIELLKE